MCAAPRIYTLPLNPMSVTPHREPVIEYNTNAFASLDVRRCLDVNLEDGLVFNNTIQFSGAVSRTQMLHFPPGTVFDRVRINLRDPKVLQLFTEEGMFAYVQRFEHSPAALGVSGYELETEVRNFMFRGHSLRNPDCTCAAQRNTLLPPQRQADYGLLLASKCRPSSKRLRDHDAPECFLGRGVCTRTSHEISQEIGAQSLDVNITLLETLRDRLLRSGIYTVAQDARNTTVWTCKHDSEILSHTQLLAFIQTHRMGVHMSHYKLQYRDVDAHVRLLERNKDIIVLLSERMMYANTLKTQLRCDADIRALWASV